MRKKHFVSGAYFCIEPIAEILAYLGAEIQPLHGSYIVPGSYLAGLPIEQIRHRHDIGVSGFLIGRFALQIFMSGDHFDQLFREAPCMEHFFADGRTAFSDHRFQFVGIKVMQQLFCVKAYRQCADVMDEPGQHGLVRVKMLLILAQNVTEGRNLAAVLPEAGEQLFYHGMVGLR